MNTPHWKTLLIPAACGAALAFGFAESAEAGGGGNKTICKGEKSRAPDGYDGFGVFIGNGQTDFAGSPGDPVRFQEEIMGRSAAEIEANRQAALAHFQQRFGIDAENDPGIFFTGFEFGPANDYRAYVLTGEKVPTSGWEVRDGGWAAIVVDPNGKTLGGEFAGITVPPNTAFAFGDYNVLKTNKNGKPKDEIIISYAAGNPVVPLLDGSIQFQCDVTSDVYGDGLAQGLQAPKLLPDGSGLQSNVRNTLTFNDNGGL